MASGRLIDYLGQGSLVDRPASLDLTPGGLGLYYNVDDSLLYTYSDNGWEEITSGVSTLTAGEGISIDATDPSNPIISSDYSLVVEENVQSGTNYTLVSSDAFKMVGMTNSAANNITVPPSSDVAFPVGTRIDVSQDGVGQTSIVAGAGVTLRTPETLKIRKRYGKATIIKRGADTWDIEGNLEAAS